MPTAAILNQERERWARNQTASLSATTAPISASVVKQTSVPITAASAPLSGSVAKKTLFILSAGASSFNASLVKQTSVVLFAVSAAFNGSVIKKTFVILSASAAALNGSLVKKTSAILSAASAAFNGSLIKKTTVVLSAAASAFSGSMVKKTTVVLSATAAAFNGSLVKKTLIILSAVASAFNGALSASRVRVMVFAASMSAMNGGVSKKISRLLPAIATALSGAQSKLTSRHIAATAASFQGNVNKSTRKFFNAVVAAYNAVVAGIKSSTPVPPPVAFKPVVLGATLQSSGVSFSNPSVVATASNVLQPFQFNGTQFIQGPANNSLLNRAYRIVAAGTVVVPPSAINAGLNLVLTLKGSLARTQPAVAILDSVVATLPSAQLLPVGTTSWQLICKVTGTQSGSTGPQGNKKDGRLTVDYTIMIGGVRSQGTLISGYNPFLESSLQFSLGVQFSGTVTDLDVFSANLFQFGTQAGRS